MQMIHDLAKKKTAWLDDFKEVYQKNKTIRKVKTVKDYINDTK